VVWGQRNFHRAFESPSVPPDKRQMVEEQLKRASVFVVALVSGGVGAVGFVLIARGINRVRKNYPTR
jgi:hypothetical protein